MIVLVGFAVLAGAGTALSPCVLPVLPALLSASGVGGRRRPLGIVLGLSITFTITIVGLASVVDGVGLGSDPLRDVAIAVLLVFGLVLLLPGVAARLEAPLSRLARFGPRSRGDGVPSGLLVGGALGFVYTPCAGPILAAVISVSAASGRTVAVAVAYSLGSAATLLALSLGGRRLFERVRRAGRGPALQRVLGAVMLITAIVIATGEDVTFDEYVARHIPEVNLTASLEKSQAVESRLPQLTGHAAKFRASSGSPTEPAGASQAKLLADAHSLKDVGVAPEFTETQRWFNTPGGRPLTLAGLRGHVVLVDFWTYTCINCLRTLPYLKAWDAAYRRDGLTIVGVHTPEFAFEHDAGNVANAIQQFGLRYPVVQDNQMGTWNAYGNQYWPADSDRRPRARALRDLRRGRVLPDRDGDPRAARRSRRAGRRHEPPDRCGRALTAGHARDVCRNGSCRRLAGRAESRHARLRATGNRRTRAQPFRPGRQLEDR